MFKMNYKILSKLKELTRSIHTFIKIGRNLVFAIIFLVGSLSITIYLVKFKEIERVSFIENRNLETFENITETSYLDGTFQNKIENALKDQFIFRYSFETFKKKFDYRVNNLFRDVSGIKNEINRIADTDLYQVGTSNYVILGLVEENEDYKNRYLKKAEEINQLQEDYPDINIYVYYPTQAHETSLFDDEEKELKSYGPMYYEIFSSALSVKHCRLEINTLEEYEKYFYQQDHHWNYIGSYQGYTDIMDMMFDGTEEILEPKEVVKSDDDLLWQGTMGSRTGYIFDPEPFYYYTYDLEPYQVFENGNETKVFNMNNIEENLNENPSSYYYDYLGGNDFYYEEFITSYPEKETLLIIGDSYASAIEPLLCQHFSNIYFVQPNNYRWLMNNGKYFDYDEFISTHEIDNILFMYTAENYFYIDTYDSFMLHREAN